MRVAIAGLHSECASTSPLQQSRDDFTCTKGKELIALVAGAFEPEDFTLIPTRFERSVPGGPLPRAVFEVQCDDILEELKAAMPLDGVLLLMHGALFVPGVEDPEGWLITRIRELVGPDAILSAAFDLHGNVTDTVSNTLDAFAAYRTAPHIDVQETRARAAHMLIRALKEGVRPEVVRTAIPVLVSGEMSDTTCHPCSEIYANLPELEGGAIWDTNLMIGYVWADTTRASAAAIVTCTNRTEGQRVADRIGQNYWDARHHLTFGMTSLPPAEALSLAISSAPATLADSGDNPTAGGVGDRADILKLLPPDAPRSLIAGICDPVACNALANGANTLELGGKLGGGGPSVEIAISDAQNIENDWIVRSANKTIVLTTKRKPFHTKSDFSRLNLSVSDYPLLIVKSGYLSPYLASLPRTPIMALTEGAVTQDFTKIPNLHRPNPTWPFQPDFEWETPCRF